MTEAQVQLKYETKRHLDTGTYGTVFLARDRASAEDVAIKYISRKQINKYVEAEVLNFSICRHPQIIQFREVSSLFSFGKLLAPRRITGIEHDI